MWLAAGRVALVVLAVLRAVVSNTTDLSVHLQCRSPVEFVPAARSPLDFAQISQRRASSMLFFQPPVANLVARDVTVPSNAFQRTDCACSPDWSSVFCARVDHYTRLPDDRAPTVCICRRVVSPSGGCTQFTTRCFAESQRSAHRLRRREFPTVYAKGDAVERGADGVLRRAWPQPQRNVTVVQTTFHVASETQPTETVARNTKNNARDFTARCRCCFNQPDEYCDQLDCGNMRPFFDAGPSANGVVCECFERRDYPRDICVDQRYDSIDNEGGGGVQARNIFLADDERRREGLSSDWRLFAKRPAFDRTTRLLRDGTSDDAQKSQRIRLVRVDVAALAALASAGAAIALAAGGYFAVRRWRGRHAAASASADAPSRQRERGKSDEVVPLEERVHIV